MEIYYSTTEEPERLIEQDISKAVEAWANDMWRIERLPEHVEVFEWHPKPMRTAECIADDALQHAIERLDEVIDKMMWRCSVLPEWRDRIKELYPDEV